MSETGEIRINRDMSLRARFHHMPPKRHDRDPHASEVLAHIRETLGCEMDRALKAFNSMRNKRSQVLVFDNVEKTWTGCFWTPSEEEERERKFRRELMALERDVAALKSDMRKLKKEVKAALRAIKKTEGSEQEAAQKEASPAPQSPVMSCNPGDQSREFAKLFEKEREEARCMKAAERLEESGPRRWLGCCDGCGYPELIGTQYPYECGDCGLPYTERGQ